MISNGNKECTSLFNPPDTPSSTIIGSRFGAAVTGSALYGLRGPFGVRNGTHLSMETLDPLGFRNGVRVRLQNIPAMISGTGGRRPMRRSRFGTTPGSLSDTPRVPFPDEARIASGFGQAWPQPKVWTSLAAARDEG